MKKGGEDEGLGRRNGGEREGGRRKTEEERRKEERGKNKDDGRGMRGSKGMKE